MSAIEYTYNDTEKFFNDIYENCSQIEVENNGIEIQCVYVEFEDELFIKVNGETVETFYTVEAAMKNWNERIKELFS